MLLITEGGDVLNISVVEYNTQIHDSKMFIAAIKRRENDYRR